jgi:hypothetical protein
LLRGISSRLRRRRPGLLGRCSLIDGVLRYERIPLIDSRELTSNSIKYIIAFVKERCPAAGLPDSIYNHSFQVTGITVFLQNGGLLEAAQDMANDSDVRPTKLYNRRKDLPTLSDIERKTAFEA